MIIGIFVQTTYDHAGIFARHIADALRERDHDVEIRLLRKRSNPNPWDFNVNLVRPPESEEYDCIIIGGPAVVGSSRVVQAYLKEEVSWKGKIAAAFAVAWKPLAFLNSTALERMSDMLEVLNAKVVEGESIRCVWRTDQHEVKQAAQRLSARIVEAGK
ncbi:MAG: hypothetical protein GF398_21550 [Chitinivibrionales bacterium]|nr:hypothetical protein [Chitinivibrionales bacterium]